MQRSENCPRREVTVAKIAIINGVGGWSKGHTNNITSVDLAISVNQNSKQCLSALPNGKHQVTALA